MLGDQSQAGEKASQHEAQRRKARCTRAMRLKHSINLRGFDKALSSDASVVQLKVLVAHIALRSAARRATSSLARTESQCFCFFYSLRFNVHYISIHYLY